MKLNKLCAALVSGALLTGTVLPAGGAMGSSVTAAQEPEPLNGRLITNLTVLDQANAADWSICYDCGEGLAIYGDRRYYGVCGGGRKSKRKAGLAEGMDQERCGRQHIQWCEAGAVYAGCPGRITGGTGNQWR